MRNQIIRLQAVAELITNQTASALGMAVIQHRQTRAAVYQNRLALDYLLAEERGVCGKF
ncbi:ENR1 protein, partial [Corythaeola cristata]|nr:ENR1 protein [Corythaeola cristata]